VVAHLPGFEALAAGCVVHRVRPERIRGRPATWVGRIERRLAGLGTKLARWYLAESEVALAQVLAQAGYESRIELGFLRDANGHPRPNDRRANSLPPGAVALRAVRTPGEWRAKRAIHELSARAPDGYVVAPELWFEMERRKWQARYMWPYLIEIEGEVGGVVNVAPCGRILRMKNLVVAPAHRRQGVATRVAIALAAIAQRTGYEAAGCFAIVGEAGARIYPGAGYRVVVRQIEWVKSLTGRRA
jgi:RimJ/RimL family protein N-acetyltransferase